MRVIERRIQSPEKRIEAVEEKAGLGSTIEIGGERSGHGRRQIMGTTDDNIIKHVNRRVREELPHRIERLKGMYGIPSLLD